MYLLCYLPGYCRIIAMHREHLHHHFGLSDTVFPHRLCPIAIKLQAEWQIPWTLCRVFAWFTHAFLSLLDHTYHQNGN